MWLRISTIEYMGAVTGSFAAFNLWVVPPQCLGSAYSLFIFTL
jgi:hypothetical protein